jgi:hypothetical protein
MLDQSNELCLYIIKSSHTTHVTIGQTTGIFSYIQLYFPDQPSQTSMEWAILPYDNKSGRFSNGGNSGSVIVDGLSHIGGLLTGGSGIRDSLDITYATCYSTTIHIL